MRYTLKIPDGPFHSRRNLQLELIEIFQLISNKMHLIRLTYWLNRPYVHAQLNCTVILFHLRLISMRAMLTEINVKPIKSKQPNTSVQFIMYCLHFGCVFTPSFCHTNNTARTHTHTGTSQCMQASFPCQPYAMFTCSRLKINVIYKFCCYLCVWYIRFPLNQPIQCCNTYTIWMRWLHVCSRYRHTTTQSYLFIFVIETFICTFSTFLRKFIWQ